MNRFRRRRAAGIAGTSKYELQHELFIRATNNEYCEGSFIWPRSGWTWLQSTRRPNTSRTALRGTATCRAACHETSVPSEKLLHLGWANLSHRSAATFVGQSTILIARASSFSI